MWTINWSKYDMSFSCRILRVKWRFTRTPTFAPLPIIYITHKINLKPIKLYLMVQLISLGQDFIIDYR
jgi:hypothetical protein